VANTILVVHFLERLSETPELRCHDLDVLGNVAVLPRIRVRGFEMAM
jgi:hypothetical protein